MGQRDPLLAGLLGLVLQVGLDRQAQVPGRHLRVDIVLGERDGLALRAGLDVFLAVLARPAASCTAYSTPASPYSSPVLAFVSVKPSRLAARSPLG